MEKKNSTNAPIAVRPIRKSDWAIAQEKKKKQESKKK